MAPSQTSKNNFVVWERIFTPAELDSIERMGDRLAQQPAQLTRPGQMDTTVRVTRVGWFRPGPEHEALFARIAAVVQRLNAQFFRFDISGLEPMQYTVYESAEGGHYTWHVDHDAPDVLPRKLSFTLQLSDPASYEGCDLQFFVGPEVKNAPRTRGAIIAFPSFFLHRVTPILSGTRKSLVIWANGPELR